MDWKKVYPKVKVTPVMWREHKTHGDLEVIRGHSNYYVNFLSGKIYYRKDGDKIATGKTTIGDAKAEVEKELERRRTGKSRDTIEREFRGERNATIEAVWESMVESCKSEWTAGTKTTYNTSWKCLREFWAKKTVLEATDDTILEFREWYLQEHPTRQAWKTVQHLKKCLRHGVDKGMIAKMPNMEKAEILDELIKRNSQYQKKGRSLSINETKTLVEKIEEYPVEGGHGATADHRRMLIARLRAGIYLAVFCGMRAKEVINLKWQKIDTKKKVLHVWSFKNHKWREVPYPKKVIEALNELRRFTGESEWCFPRPTKTTVHISKQNFDKLWFKVRELCGFEDHVMFHDLRRTCATRMGELGWPPQQACLQLDMTLETYMKYYFRPSSESKAKLVKDQEAFFQQFG